MVAERIKSYYVGLSLAALGFIPLLWGYGEVLWSRPAYQFYPLALFAAGMLAWRSVREIVEPLSPGKKLPAWALVITTGIVFLLAHLYWSPWLGYIDWLLALVTALWCFGGEPLVRSLSPAGLVLLTILPPPLGWDETLTLWLRAVAVNFSSVLLDWLNVTHVQDGDVLLLPDKKLLVEEACSGINSFILGNAFCVFWLLWRRRPLSWLLWAIPATSGFVLLGNVFRITAGAAAFYYWQFDLLSGRTHEFFGLLLLLVYCGLVLSIDQLLLFSLNSIHNQTVDNQTPASHSSQIISMADNDQHSIFPPAGVKYCKRRLKSAAGSCV